MHSDIWRHRVSSTQVTGTENPLRLGEIESEKHPVVAAEGGIEEVGCLKAAAGDRHHSLLRGAHRQNRHLVVSALMKPVTLLFRGVALCQRGVLVRKRCHHHPLLRGAHPRGRSQDRRLACRAGVSLCSMSSVRSRFG